MTTIIPGQPVQSAPTIQNKEIILPSEGYLRFAKAANPELDEVTMILRCHLLAEYHLDQFIVAFLPRGDVITDGEKARFMFNEKLTIVKSFNILPQHLIDSLYKLNSIRNKCGHEQEYGIMESDIDKIGHPFGMKYLDYKNKNKGKVLLHNTLLLIISILDAYVSDYIEKQREVKKSI